MSAYFPHDVAAEIVSQMDGYTESEGTEFTAEHVWPNEVRIESTRPDGARQSFRFVVQEITE